MLAGQSTMDGNSTFTLDTDLIELAMHNLSIGGKDLVNVLTDCNIYLNKLNRSDLYKAANLIDLNLIFDCLNTTEEKQIEIACLLLKKLLSILLPKNAFNKYSISIERSLHHPSNVVKSTILSEMEKLLAVDNNVDIQVDLACILVDCLSNSDIPVSYNAVKCLKKLNVEILSSPPILSKIKSMMLMDEKIRTRIYDILIHWAISDDALSLITSKGLFSNLVNDITGPDVMMQMVIIQMLIPLSITDAGFDYLSSVGIIRGLYSLLSSRPEELDNPKVFILNPIVMEFFINIMQIRPHLIFTTYPKVFVVIYEVLKEGEYPKAGVAINAIISLASSWDCKIALNVPTTIKTCGFQGEEELDIWSIFIVELSDIATGSQNELRAGAVQAITRIIQVESGELSSKYDMFAHTHKWYKQIKDNPLKNIVQASCLLPFLDIQQAGFEMLLALAEQPWGQEEINKFPSLLDIVFKKCPKDPIVINDLKRTIIKTLLESDTSEDIFNEDLMSRIKNYGTLKFGINSSQPEVAVEDMVVE